MPTPPKTTEPLTGVDRAWLRMDDPTNLMTINGVVMLDQPADHEEIKAILETRLLNIPDSGSESSPRGRSAATTGSSTPRSIWPLMSTW